MREVHGTRAERAAMEDEFYSSEGLRIYNSMRANQITFHTFRENYCELDALIRLHFKLNTEGKLGDSYDRKPLNDFLFEVTRRLHNFVFSARTLVEHTENFIVKCYGRESNMQREYKTEVDKHFAASGIDEFTKDLRDFFAHRSTPFIRSVKDGSVATGADRFTLQLNVDEMKGSRPQSDGATNYIGTHGGDVDLGLYAQEYYELVMRFYCWLDDKNQEWSKEAWERSLAIHDATTQNEDQLRPKA